MNIFVLHKDPRKNAPLLASMHLGKVGILELSQIIHEALVRSGVITNRIFKEPKGNAKPIDWLFDGEKLNPYKLSWCADYLDEAIQYYSFITGNYKNYKKSREINKIVSEFYWVDRKASKIDFDGLRSYNENTYPENRGFYKIPDVVASYRLYYKRKLLKQVKRPAQFKEKPKFWIKQGLRFEHLEKKDVWQLMRK